MEQPKPSPRPRGRPPMQDQSMQQIAIRLPKALIEEADRMAKDRDMSRSDIIRTALEAALPILGGR